jgi:hypothetical protein
VAAKACVACGKLIAEAFTVCAFCKAAQPASLPPASKETRCTTCKRPYAARLASCPHCERDKSSPSQPSLTPRSGGGGSSSSPSVASSAGLVAAPDPPENRMVGSAMLLGGPLVLGAIWGGAQAFHGNRLGGQESGGLFWTCVAFGFLSALALGLLFLRRSHGTLRDAFEESGVPRFFAVTAIATALALVPAALTVYGLVIWWNGLAIGGREQEVVCKGDEPLHKTTRGADMGWSFGYRCELQGGEVLIGSLHSLPVRPDLGPDGDVRFRAARGRAGIWVRRSDPVPRPPTPARD